MFFEMNFLLLEYMIKGESVEEYMRLDKCKVRDKVLFFNTISQRQYGNKFEGVCIEKCNAIIFLLVYYQEENFFLKVDQAFSLWDESTSFYLSGSNVAIKAFFQEDAIRHMCEVAVGLHSLVIGDNQVRGQILSKMLRVYTNDKKGELVVPYIRSWIKKVSFVVLDDTRLNRGLVSCERIAVKKLLDAKIPKDSSVVVLGVGRSGTLVAQILLKETSYRVVLIDKLIENASCLEKYRSFSFVELKNVALLKNIGAVFVCLHNNVDNKRWVELITLAVERDVLFVELATPSFFVNSKGESFFKKNVFTLSELVRYSSINKNIRKSDARKAIKIIDDNMSYIIKKTQNIADVFDPSSDDDIVSNGDLVVR